AERQRDEELAARLGRDLDGEEAAVAVVMLLRRRQWAWLAGRGSGRGRTVRSGRGGCRRRRSARATCGGWAAGVDFAREGVRSGRWRDRRSRPGGCPAPTACGRPRWIRCGAYGAGSTRFGRGSV